MSAVSEADLREVSVMRISRLAVCFLSSAVLLLAFFYDTVFSGETLLAQVISYGFWKPLVILALVICFENFVVKLDMLAALCTLAEQPQLKKTLLALIPSLIGILPTIGGAHFSLALLQSAIKKDEVSNENLSTINYWFRHVHVFSNPLIAGTVTACVIADTSLNTVLLILTPLTVIFSIFGWIFLIRPLNLQGVTPSEIAGKKQFPWFFILCLLIIAAGVVMDMELALSLGLVVFISAGVSVCTKGASQTVGALILKPKDLGVLVDVFSVLFFVVVLRSTGITDRLSTIIISAPFEPFLALSAAIFVLGLLTGISQAYVALVIPIAAVFYSGNAAIVALLLGIGMISQFLTPAHLCLVVTAQSCGVSVLKILKKIVKPFVASTVCAAAYGLVVVV